MGEVSRVERLINLLALLLDTKRPLSRDEILGNRELQYSLNPDSARRAFERDKEALQALGVTITTNVLADGIQMGYRVLPSDYYLPDLGLDDDELAAMQIAVGAVSLESQAGAGALMKIGGVVPVEAPPVAALALLPNLGPIFEALRTHAVLAFEYSGSQRSVEPWTITSERGRWYLVGFDRSRQGRRTFRVDRISGGVDISGRGSVHVPADAPSGATVAAVPVFDSTSNSPVERVELAFDPPHDVRAVSMLGAVVSVDELSDGRKRVAFDATELDVVRSFVLEFLEHCEVLAPPRLRADVIAWLQSVAAGEGAP